MTLEELKQRVSRWRDDYPMAAVVDLLSQKWAGPETRYSTQEISEELGVPVEKVMSAFLLLTNDPIPVLSAQWIYVDGDREFPLPDDTLYQVLKNEAFQHPETGAPVLDYLQTIYRVHTPGSALNALMRGVEMPHG